MAGAPTRRLIVDVRWPTLLKIIAAVAMVWLWVQLWDLVLLLLVTVLLAVTLDPLVRRVERRGLPRWGAATLVGVVLLLAIGGLLAFAWTSLADQAAFVGKHLAEFEQDTLAATPPLLRQALGIKGGPSELVSYAGPYVLRVIRSMAGAAIVFVLAFILTIYLLIEGDRTRAWLLAFVSRRHRRRTEATLRESQRVIFGYVAGNIATSVFATVFVFVVLTVLKVPAALLLALVAGVCDFVPVVGFIASASPAVLLALSVSPRTGIAVAICYVAYHLAENYLIAPRVYGDRLKLSNVAVVLAFAVGATLAGVVGAVVALPLAAVYPAVERIWLRDALSDETVEEHREIEAEHKGG